MKKFNYRHIVFLLIGFTLVTSSFSDQVDLMFVNDASHTFCLVNTDQKKNWLYIDERLQWAIRLKVNKKWG